MVKRFYFKRLKSGYSGIGCTISLLFCFQFAGLAQDSLKYDPAGNIGFHKKSFFRKGMNTVLSSKTYQMTYIGLPLIVGGLIVKSEDDHFRRLRNDYMPSFSRHYDDYMQYLPAAVMLGMKIGGIESRSSWSRMLVSDAFSAILMGSVVNTLKRTTLVTRPDGSDRHSFPSGHTATAFMTATMLNKEYGYKSPWIGIGAYTVAAGTGMMRMANNKHWLSDIMVGAGVGVLTTEMGYFIADLIFKDRGIRSVQYTDEFDRLKVPSFVSLYMGFNVPLSHYDLDDETVFKTSSGSTAGFEGAYFFNPYIGLGGRFAISNTAVIVNDSEAQDNTFDAVSLCGGPYFSYPVSSRWLIGSKLLAGYMHYPELKLSHLKINDKNGLCFGSRLSLTFRARDYFGVRFFLDYDLIPPHSSASKEYMNMLTLGISFAVTLSPI